MPTRGRLSTPRRKGASRPVCGEIQPKQANSQIWILEKLMAITATKEYGGRMELIEKKLAQVQGNGTLERLPGTD
jgi:hypothetical protein